jgi:hypothetical protein
MNAYSRIWSLGGIVSVLWLMAGSLAFSQNPVATKHPRVIEVEEILRDESARYFNRRFPNTPVLVRVEIFPLRRDQVLGRKTESLPYFDYESEESIDEWDDPKTPVAFLKTRVTKVTVEISVPDDFNEKNTKAVQDELLIYLKLVPFRDEVKVEKKLNDSTPWVDHTVITMGLMILFSALSLGFIIRSAFLKVKPQQAASGAASAVAAPSVGVSSSSSGPKSEKQKISTAVTGDVTFHDPIKTMDIVRLKLDQIEKSGTFPTFKDLSILHDLAQDFPDKVGALVFEMPTEWQKQLFPLGIGQSWLEAFSNTGVIDHLCLVTLDKMGKDRALLGGEKVKEKVLIQMWRMQDQAVNWLKKIPQDHALVLLNDLPKTIGLTLAKKAFPGGWGRLLEKQTSQGVILTPNVLQDYLQQMLSIEPYYEHTLLENYRKDRELLNYLDRVSIQDEKDVYDSLPSDSFVMKVRKPFYVVFEQSDNEWKKFVLSYPLEKWALVVMNSSRNYIRRISDVLDEKQKLMFSQYLKMLDNAFTLSEQILWKKAMADALAVKEIKVQTEPTSPNTVESDNNEAQSA